MEFYLAFLAGFFSSMHCVGMCGAIVLAYSTQHKLATITSIIPGFMMASGALGLPMLFLGGENVECN